MTLHEKYKGWALITGASSGIGEEFAKRLASKKLDLILVARRKNRLNKLAKEFKANHGIQVVVAAIDLSKQNFMDELKKKVGKREVSVLINNAGFGYNGNYVDGNTNRFEEMVNVNCLAPALLTHYFAKQMIERKNGAIIFLGSLVGYQPTPMTTLYSATKAFNLFLGESLWYELREHNVDVLALNPGGTATEFQKVAGTSAGPIPRSVQQVVDTAMKYLGKKPSVVDGNINRVMSFIPRLISRKLTVNLAGKMRKKLYTAPSVFPEGGVQLLKKH